MFHPVRGHNKAQKSHKHMIISRNSIFSFWTFFFGTNIWVSQAVARQRVNFINAFSSIFLYG
jgi:hypothetical protein